VGLPSCRRRKAKRRKYWICKVFRAREEEGEFLTMFERLKDDKQKISNILEYVFRNLKLEIVVAHGH
jgi:hypothetical protein